MAIVDIVRGYEVEHEQIRDEHLLLHKKGVYYFDGNQRVYYDSDIQDLRKVTDSPDYDPNIDDEFNRVVNIHRAHGEAVIAALSIDVPGVNFIPDDPRRAADVDTARNFSNAVLLIQRHNKAELLYAHAVYLAWTSPLVAAYHYLKKDKKYGETKEKIYKDVDEDVIEEDVDGNFVTTKSTKKVYDKTLNTPKEGICIELFGVDKVKVSPFAKCLEDSEYLIYEFEESISSARQRLQKDIPPVKNDSSYETQAREPRFASNDVSQMVTVKCVWLRPKGYYRESLELGQELEEKYPSGMYAEIINNEVMEEREENVDDFWSILQNPLTMNIHMNPLGQPLFDPQDIQNDIINLSVDTMSQSIPETFADPSVLNFQEYGKSRKVPGQVTQAKALANQNLSAGFFTTKTASMSQEIDKFDSKMQQYSQLVVGAFPSIYGGTLQGGSKTFAEYSASRNQALQRLSLIHKALTFWWAEVMGKCAPIYVDALTEDIRFTQQIAKDEYLSLKIIADANDGNIGHVEPSASNSLPISWGQKRDILISLLQMKEPMINATLFSPENSHILVDLSGIPELKLIGDDSRVKQLREISLMIGAQASGDQPSVPVDVQVDEHPIEYQVCKSFLNSSEGQELKYRDVESYMNILAHMNQHSAAMVQNPNGNGPDSRGSGNERPADSGGGGGEQLGGNSETPTGF